MSSRFRLITAFLLLGGCAEVGKGPDDGDIDVQVTDPSVYKVVGTISYGQPLSVAYKNPPKWYSYGFDGHASDALDVRVHSDTGDSMVRILDAQSNVLAANDDADGSLDSHATFKLTAGGKYYISVRDYNLKTVTLRITLLGGTSCQKHTCAGEGAECGSLPDGCGGTLECGSCTAPETCGGGGTPNVCGAACAPESCADLGADCGTPDDGCGGTLHCGACTAPDTCGGGGTPHVCGGTCAPRTCADAGANCGSLADGCGGTVQCGTCDAGTTCGGGGTPNVCGGSGDPYTGLSDDALKAKIHDVESIGYVSLGYTDARKYLYKVGGLSDQGGQIECIYTGTLAAATSAGTAPGGFNTEHTWPASLGAAAEPMHSDLHHLFPTIETANSARANYYYGMTSCGDAGQAACNWTQAGSQLGTLTGGSTLIFEVRPNHRGDVARAWFYFSTRYQIAIPDWSETILKQWHAADPPDAPERARNDKVEALQHTRNVFIDRPDLVSRIRDF
jgi:hypothetical protein